MKHTNKYGMPYVYDKMIRRLARKYAYIAPSTRPSFSVTSLGGSAYRYKLARLHDDEIEEDVLDVFFAFRGQMMHKALEDVSLQNVIPEVSLGLELDGVWLSGRIDTVLPGVIEDYKMRTVEAMWFHSDDDVQELARQLNPYNYMLFKTFGIFMPRLVGHILFMNWVGSRAKREKGYPNKPHFEINVPVWTVEQTEEYLRERIRLFLLPIEETPICTPKERWQRQETWAVVRAGRKTALRVLDTESEALAWMDRREFTQDAGYSIQKREGLDARCMSYCNVCKFCPYWQEKYSEREVQEGTDDLPFPGESTAGSAGPVSQADNTMQEPLPFPETAGETPPSDGL